VTRRPSAGYGGCSDLARSTGRLPLFYPFSAS
jgi:hypothetical protein